MFFLIISRVEGDGICLMLLNPDVMTKNTLFGWQWQAHSYMLRKFYSDLPNNLFWLPVFVEAEADCSIDWSILEMLRSQNPTHLVLASWFLTFLARPTHAQATKCKRGEIVVVGLCVPQCC